MHKPNHVVDVCDFSFCFSDHVGFFVTDERVGFTESVVVGAVVERFDCPEEVDILDDSNEGEISDCVAGLATDMVELVFEGLEGAVDSSRVFDDIGDTALVRVAEFFRGATTTPDDSLPDKVADVDVDVGVETAETVLAADIVVEEEEKEEEGVRGGCTETVDLFKS